MAGDALDLFRATRPQGPPVPTGDIRAPSSNRSRELHGLAMVPGQPGYNERIPKPPCYKCGEDHWPNQPYDHPWEPEPAHIHDEPVQASPSFRQRTEVIEVAPALRLAVYVGRNDLYVLSVESPPDWDAVQSFKVTDDMLLLMVRMARALGVKVYDKTGGDLVMLEQEDAGQHAKDNGRGAEGAGSPGPRRPGPPADRTPEDQQERALPPSGGVH